MKLKLWLRFSSYTLMGVYYGVAWLIARRWHFELEHVLLAVLLYASASAQMEFYFYRRFGFFQPSLTSQENSDASQQLPPAHRIARSSGVSHPLKY